MRLKTGPQTDAGKAITSQNARTHGLTAKKLLVLPEDRPEFDQLHDQLLDECKPEGMLETELFRQILHAQWNLRRCDQVEQEVFDALQIVARVDPASGKSLDPLLHGDNDVPRQLDRIQRYRTAHNRAWHRALRELKALQTNRCIRAIEASPQGLRGDAHTAPASSADLNIGHPPLADETKILRFLNARSRLVPPARESTTNFSGGSRSEAANAGFQNAKGERDAAELAA